MSKFTNEDAVNKWHAPAEADKVGLSATNVLLCDAGLEQHYYKAEEKPIQVDSKPEIYKWKPICAICGSDVETNTCVRSIST